MNAVTSSICCSSHHRLRVKAGRCPFGEDQTQRQKLDFEQDSFSDILLRHAPVAQLDRVTPSEGVGHRFDSCRVRHFSKKIKQLA